MFISKCIFEEKKFIFFIIIFILFHLITLNISPLPWFDEACYLDMTMNLINRGSLHMPIASFDEPNEVLIYGPIYFYIQKFVINIFGIGIFQFRILNFISGCIVVFITYMILKKILNIKFYKFILFIFCFEPIFLQNLHSGRMDLVSLAFCLTGFYLYFKNINNSFSNSVLETITIGILLTASLLTTPRIIFCFPFLFIFSLMKFKNIELIKKSILIASIFCLFFSIWINLKFNNLENFLNIVLFNKTIKTHVVENKSLFNNIVRYKYHFFLTLMTFLSILYFALNFKKYLYVQKIVGLFSITTIISYHIIVAEAGPYFAMVLPFYLLIFALAFSSLKTINPSFFFIKYRLIETIILSPFIIIFLTKSIVIVSSYKDRNHKIPEEFINKNIPSNSRVIGNFKFYYACLNNKNSFENFEFSFNPINMINHHRLDYNYEYIIVDSNLKNKSFLNEYLKKEKHVIIDSLTFESSPFFKKVLKICEFMNIKMTYNYSGIIYKRIK